MSDPTTLNLSRGSTNAIEVDLRDEQGNGDDLSGLTAFVLKISKSADPTADGVVSKNGTAASNVVSFPGLTAPEWATLKPGRYWGHLSAVDGSDAVRGASPIAVEVD